MHPSPLVRSPLVLLVPVLLLAGLPVSAQAQAGSALELAIANASTNGNATLLQVDVTLQLRGITCAAATPFPVLLEIGTTAVASGSAQAIPDQLVYTVPAGTYLQTAFVGTQTSAIELRGAGNYTINANLEAGNRGCIAAGTAVPAAAANTTAVVDEVTVTGRGEEGGQAMPAPLPLLGLLLVFALLVLRRRG
jgi:hypothetical protein